MVHFKNNVILTLAIVSIFLICLCLSCSHISLSGRWELDDKIPFSIYNYPVIEFDTKGIVILKSYGDTLHSGSFKSHENNIIIKVGQKEEFLYVEKFTVDSLVLHGFDNVRDTLTYLRRKK